MTSRLVTVNDSQFQALTDAHDLIEWMDIKSNASIVQGLSELLRQCHEKDTHSRDAHLVWADDQRESGQLLGDLEKRRRENPA